MKIKKKKKTGRHPIKEFFKELFSQTFFEILFNILFNIICFIPKLIYRFLIALIKNYDPIRFP